MRILIIDDEPALVDLFRDVARGKGYKDVDVAYSGEEGLARAIRGHYHLITLDIRMPGVSGLEILSLLRTMSPHAVIAVVSAHLPEDVSDELAGCADVLIAKPLKVQKFYRLLEIAARIHDAVEEVRLLGDADWLDGTERAVPHLKSLEP